MKTLIWNVNTTQNLIIDMGCHTWFYAKPSNYNRKDLNMLKQMALQRVKMFYRWDSFDEWKQSQINFAPEWMELAEEMKQEGNMYSYRDAMSKWRKCMNPLRRDWLKLRRERTDTIRKLKAKSISRNELIRIMRKNVEHFSYIKDPFPEKRGWYCSIVPGYSDNFRIHDYDAKPWFCYEDFCKYLEEHPDKEVYSCIEEGDKVEAAKKVVKRFFEMHPEGFISLG